MATMEGGGVAIVCSEGAVGSALGSPEFSKGIVDGAGAAGKVIESFGSFVVGGNYVVGLAVFIILVIINFVVITKGAGRIAEVAARFTLDAMPGKQMECSEWKREHLNGLAA